MDVSVTKRRRILLLMAFLIYAGVMCISWMQEDSRSIEYSPPPFYMDRTMDNRSAEMIHTRSGDSKPARNGHHEDLIRNDIDLSTIPNGQTSTLQIVNSREYYTIGEELRVIITLRDSKGKLRIGGDYLRIWMKEPRLHASVTGHIHDFRNGSYMGSILLPWKGKPVILVSVATPVQIQNIMVNGLNKFGLSHKMAGKYVAPGGSSAIANCSPLPIIPGYSEVCNVTSLNYDVAWYCGKPKNPSVSCDQWAKSSSGESTYSPSEDKAMVTHQHIGLKQNLSIDVRGLTDTIKTKPIPCNKRPKQDTWHERTLGFNYKSIWIYLGCTITLQRSPDSYRACLRGRHLLMIGDSNMRSFAAFFVQYLKLKTRAGNVNLHVPGCIYADDKTADVSMTWTSHGMPFFSKPFYDNSLLIPPWDRMDEIKPGNKSIILIHMWFHFVRIPIHVFRIQIRRLRVSLESLLARVPTVTVLIKGPHSMLYHGGVGLDYSRIHHERFWREEFEGLKNKIVYLKNWDITVAGENFSTHPGPKILTDMIHNFLSFVCGS